MAESDLFSRVKAALGERYALERELGQGGTAIVYLAQDLRHSRPVAIKVMRPELAAAVGADRFLHEIETVARLQHPHILPLYDSGEADGLVYFVMMYAQGETLRDRMEREHQLSVDDAVAIARDVASALSYAHQQEVIHRDIKPENILLIGGVAMVADFGIARALRVAAHGGRTTEAGMALGTPLYMSPEQASASGEIDARSDVYSLGCVLYEMLVGEPPFTGMSAVDVLAHHLGERPRTVATRRAGVPQPLSLAISRALAKLPADRFRTAEDFSDALRISGARTPIPMPVPRGVRRLAVSTVGLVAVTASAVLAYRNWPARLDDGLHVVLPFAVTDSSAPSNAGQRADVLVYESLHKLRGVRVVDPIKARDAWDRAGAVQGLDKMVSVARKTGAGSVLWGDVAPGAADSLVIRAGLYRVGRTAKALRTKSISVPARPQRVNDVARQVSQLVAELLLETTPDLSAERWIGTDTLAALDAFAAGFSAFQQGRLVEARERFRAAATADPGYAQAQLWLAQVESWLADGTPSWRVSARVAAGLLGRLASGKDSGYVLGLAALADSQDVAACDQYRSLIARDSGDPVAWYGLGECQRQDEVVVADPSSPSGWRFRTSIEGAVRAYRRSFALAPNLNYAFGTQVFSRAEQALFADPNRPRVGRHTNGDTVAFGAYAGLDADTLSFVPVRLAELIHLQHMPPSHDDAVAHGRRVLRDIASEWVSAYGGSADAHAALSAALERLGLLDGAASALSEIHRARELTVDAYDALRRARSELRIRLKAGDHAAARALADSMLIGPPTSDPRMADILVGVAALRGRVFRTAQLNATVGVGVPVFDVTSGRRVQIGSDLARAVRRFNAYAAFGAPVDSLVHYERLCRDLIARWFPSATDQARMRYVLLNDGAAYAFFQLGVRAVPPVRETDYFAPMLVALAAGRLAEVRAGLDSLVRRRTGRPADVAILSAYHESLLYLAAGDSGGAQRHLAGVVEGLPAAGLYLLGNPYHSAAIVRAFALHAQLASARGDAATARRYAGAVLTLWDGSDPPVRPVVDAMRRLAGPP